MWRSKRAVGQVWRVADPGEDGESRDARLVAGLRRGAPGAFAGLHEEYAAGIYTLALRMVRHAPDAEDITQDVLIRAYERLPREREVLLRPWLYRLTLNRCYDHLRAAARRRPATPAGRHSGRAGGGDGHAVEAELASPVDLFEQSELQRLFEAALLDLTRRQRAALLLKDVHGLALVEVAECLELTPGSVEVLLARARKAFRGSYAGHCRAAGRPAPSTAGLLAGLLALPLCALPPGLLAPPALPTVLPMPMSLPPVAAGGGIGIGAALSLPASFKTAALIIAAATTVGTAEVAMTRGDLQPVKRAAATASTIAAAPAVMHERAASPGPRPSGSAAAAVISPSPVATVAAAPDPSPAASADPLASPTPLGIPSMTPSPDVTPSASPKARATTAPSPSPSPSPSPPSPTPSP